MPQHLYIEVGGECIADMMTSNCGGSSYDIYWKTHDGIQHHFPNFNTGVLCQPKDRSKRWFDSRNDYIHAHRAIAAASLTANQFLSELKSVGKPIETKFEMALIILRTNNIDRGKITIKPLKDEKVSLTMEIGTGPNRLDNSKPTQSITYSHDVIGITSPKSPLELTLTILNTCGDWIQNTLKDNITSRLFVLY